MLTKNEITALNLSPTKKDFVQIWNELLEVAGKLSERWDPTSTNESDPGIVLLKALTGIADKLNYNIDKNTLEAFMPTAAQEESMRKLCDMLGYNIKYYQSATTNVTIRYHNSDPTEEEKAILAGDSLAGEGLKIPRFTVFTNVDQTVNYFSINHDEPFISNDATSVSVECMEGQIVKCTSINEDGLITANQITTDNRFYLPETQIAENGIFIYNIITSDSNGTISTIEGPRWTKVDNLNTVTRGTLVYKFGFDSYEGRPYIEFPEDYSELFGSGINIYYARTSGANGNISPRTLVNIEAPNSDAWSKVSTDSFSIENPVATNTGSNPETISQAYRNFKKTIGTFDTLVTCRDYMNKIYSMVNDENRPYVSNVLVTDIRNDLNRSITICTADDSGIFYKEKPLYEEVEVSRQVNGTIDSTKPVFNVNENATDSKWHLGSSDGLKLFKTSFLTDHKDFKPLEAGEVSSSSDGYWCITQTIKEADGENPAETKTFKTLLRSTAVMTATESQPAIDHFDLVLYPFKSYNQVKSNVKDIRAVYDSSFSYTTSSFEDIRARLTSNQLSTIAHAFKQPRKGDILSINNYLRLNALISTNTKLTVEESAFIVDKIKIDLANAFNMRELDFGEEIPFDDILAVIEAADSRIRIVSLAEPALYTTYSVLKDIDKNGSPVIVEYAVASNNWLPEEAALATKRFRDTSTPYAYDQPLDYYDTAEARQIYNKLVIRNILAGRIPLFNYNDTFKTEFAESPYRITEKTTDIPDGLEATADNPIVLLYKDDKVYTCINGDGCYVTHEPYESLQENKQAPVQELSTFCNIAAPAGIAEDVTLADGEYIKFRAPNFITETTYPAYVNYHLHLNSAVDQSAVAAEGLDLFTKLDEDRLSYDYENGNMDITWAKVLSYFGQIDNALYGEDFVEEAHNEHSTKSLGERKEMQDKLLIKRCNLLQKCSAFAPADTEGVSEAGKPFDGKSIVAELVQATTTDGQTAKTPQEYLAESGCLHLMNEITDDGFKVKLYWADDSSSGSVLANGMELVVPVRDANGKLNPFIVDEDTLTQLGNAVNEKLDELRYMRTSGGQPILPTTGDWYIEFVFNCVPFSVAALPYWETFVQNLEVQLPTDAVAHPSIKSGVNFNIVKDAKENAFWRLYEGGYSKGKYITENGEKYLPIEANYIKNLPTKRMQGVYVLFDLGEDEQPAIILNGEEYELRNGERLYFEYTPSTQNADGTSETLPPVTKVYEAGTIIRPSGFEPGLIDSVALKNGGKSYTKEDVSFKTNTNSGAELVKLHSLGANEQIEIRDFARVVLQHDTLTNLYMYKNFDCEILESNAFNDAATNSRSYTLKDGEYIFYTDYNKAELAFFTNGTKVEIQGSVVIPKFDKIEIATILDTGIDEVPWQYIPLTAREDAIIFQEYQYVTLGSGDKLGRVILTGHYSDKIAPDEIPHITSEWAPCEKDATYYLSSDLTKEIELPPVRLASSVGGGWEICSVLELDAAPGNSQTLRCTDKVSTGLQMSAYLGGSLANEPVEITPKKKENSTDSYPLAFKTNLNCQINSTKVSMDDIYSNPNEYPGFQVKLFAKNPPAIVKTVRGKTFPYSESSTPAFWDFATWTGAPVKEKSNLDLWTSIDMSDVYAWKTEGVDKDWEYDQALKLSVNILPQTYGLMSIYVSYTSDEAAAKANTWFELLPGAEELVDEIITPLNYAGTMPRMAPSAYTGGDSTLGVSTRMLLKPGLNCLRINKSCTFFIKTSTDAQGTISFDDVRLVNLITKSKETTREYIQNAFGISQKEEGPKEILTEYGLNLEQIQYLPIAEAGRVLDDEVADALQAEVQKGFDAAEAQLALNASAIISEKLGNAKTVLADIAAKILKIEGEDLDVTKNKLITSIETELNKITIADNREALATARKQLKDSIKAGEALIDILNSSEDTKQLATQFAEAQKELFSALDDADLKKLVDELADAQRKLSSQEIPIDTPEETYEMLETVAAAENGNSVVRALAKLAVDADKAKKQELLSKIIEEIQTPQAHEDYRQVLTSIADLYSILYSTNATNNLKLAELQYYSDSEALQQVRAAIELFITRLEATGETTIINKDTGETATTYTEDVTDALASLRAALESLETASVGKLITLLGDDNALINALLSAAATSTSGKLNSSGVLISNEAVFAQKELDRVTALLTDYTTTAAKLYVKDETQDILNLLSTLLTDGEPLLDSEVEIQESSEVTTETLSALADLCKQLPTEIPSKHATQVAWAIELIQSLQEVLASSANTEAIIEALKLCGCTDAVCKDKDACEAAEAAKWSLLSEVLDSNSLTVKLQQLKANCILIKNISTPVSDIINTVVTNIGANSQLSDALNSINLAEQDPLGTLVSALVTELKKTTPDSNKVALLGNKLRSLVKSETELLGYIDNRLAVAINKATEAILAINPKSAIVANLKQEALKDTADYVTCLEQSFAAEHELYVIVNQIAKIPDILRNPKQLLDAIAAYKWLEQQVEEEKARIGEEDFDASLYAINSWVSLPDAMLIYDDIADVLDVLDEVHKKIAANSNFESLSDLLDTLAQYKDQVLNPPKDKEDTDAATGLSNSEKKALRKQLLPALYVLENTIKSIDIELRTLPVTIEERCRISLIEDQLMQEIRSLDADHEFYYGVKVEDSLAIDFNESDDSLNNMMNPAINYNVNNVNNSFVISKLDIDHLTKGIQLARSSRLN